MRQGDTSFHEAAADYQAQHPELAESVSAFSQSVGLASLGEANVPTLSMEELQRGFFHIRDHRFLRSSSFPDFPRRESWLYPDDGCYSRAALASRQFDQIRLPKPAKAFIFGNLEAKTENSPGGAVYWWFHVAPILAVNDPSRLETSGSYPENWYVLDPTLEPSRPLKLMDWVMLQTDDPESVRIAICDAHTYRPEDPCEAPPVTSDSEADTDEDYFLGLEWLRQLELGRDPHAVLGSTPPWNRT